VQGYAAATDTLGDHATSSAERQAQLKGGRRCLHAISGGTQRPAAAEELIRLTSLIRPMVDLHWVRMAPPSTYRRTTSAPPRWPPTGSRAGPGTLALARTLYAHLPVGSPV
jgi:hypothetical protein